MNATQQKLVEMKKNIPDCTSSRQRLRSILSDYFPMDKQLINSILNAYDEDVEAKLKSSKDRTLTALQLIRVIQNDYGLTAVSARSAVEAWCYMLAYTDIAEALGEMDIVQNQPAAPIPSARSSSTYQLGFGIYKAGVDFPAGEVCLEVRTSGVPKVYYGIGKNPNRIDADEYFADKTYIHVTNGQFLKLENYCNTDEVKIIASSST